MRFFFCLIFLCLLLLSSCNSSTHAEPEECVSGVYSNNVCCTYVCDKDCPYGYQPNTCNCECLSEPSFGLEQAFDSDNNITPPSIPIT